MSISSIKGKLYNRKRKESIKEKKEIQEHISNTNEKVLVIVGAGVMGITAAMLVNELSKSIGESIKIIILESQAGAALESTRVLNNAGTGHEANCELNFTPGDKHNVNIQKALDIHAQYNISKQFWAYLTKEKIIENITDIIHKVKHVSVVQDNDIGFLKTRYNTMKKHYFFDSMKFSENIEEVSKWIPLITSNWNKKKGIGATMVPCGTDVNFGKLTEEMAKYLETQDNIEIHYNTYVKDIKKKKQKWNITTVNKKTQKKEKYVADTMLSAAGGGSIGLLKKSGIPQAKDYSSFPVGGGFLMASDVADISQIYNTKAYGKARNGAPPMSVPHLDIRYINNKTHILFGPFALFKLKLGKYGNLRQYLKTIRLHDIFPMLKSSKNNIDLMWYLIQESFKAKSKPAMIKELERFAPGLGKREGFNWKFTEAGQRVQVIENGELKFGTKMVYSDDRSFSSLLGASPGASVSPEVMLKWVETVFPDLTKAPIFKSIFPESDINILKKDKEKYYEIRNYVNEILGIQVPGNSDEK